MEKFTSLKQHREKTSIFARDGLEDRHFEYYYVIMDQIFGFMEENCPCQCIVKEHVDKRGKLPTPDTECSCDSVQQAVLPFYHVTVRNDLERCTGRWWNKDTFELLEDGPPKTLTYLLHPSEREHMERYLAGTDNVLFEMVHELRYGVQGRDTQAAQADFEYQKKKQKTTE